MVTSTGTSEESLSSIALPLAIFSSVAFLFVQQSKRKKENESNGIPGVAVTQLNIYPIKSCAEVSLQVAKTTPRGFENDRVAQVIDKNNIFCTPRDPKNAKLFHVTPKLDVCPSQKTEVLVLEAPGMSDALEIDLAHAATSVVTADAMESPGVQLQDFGEGAASWMEKATGIDGCRLVGIGDKYVRNVKVNPDQGEAVPTGDKTPVSLADEAPYLLTNEASLKDLNRRLQECKRDPVDMRRFRPNIVISNLCAWEEDSIKKVRIGKTAEFWVWQRCGRCTMTTIDRDNLSRGAEPLRTLSTFRERANGQRNFGVHLVPVEGQQNTELHVGDTIEVLEYDQERRDEWKKLLSS